MANQTVTGDEVYVAGSFNGWNATESLMIPLGNGIYQLPIAINSGDDVSYKFVNGSTWESVPADCGVSDGFGGFNRAFTATVNEEIAPVCFNECAACVVVQTLTLTIKVEMTEVTISPMGVHVAGSFNNFSPTATPMPKKVEPKKVEDHPATGTPFEQVEKIITMVEPVKTLEAMRELQNPSKENARSAFMRAQANTWKKAAEAAKASLLGQDLDAPSSKWMRDVMLTSELFENERFESVQGKLKELDSGWLNLKTDFKIYGPEGAPKKE
jgi:hypothetical protein